MPYLIPDFRSKIRTSLVLILLATVLFSSVPRSEAVAQSATDSSISYTVDLTNVKNHYVTVIAELPAEGNSTDLMMAVWTPGSYLVREYARNVDSVEVTSSGKPLDFEKTRKNRWQVQTDGVKKFQVKYRLYCNELSVRTNWVGKQFAVLNGAPTFLTIPKRLQQKHFVNLKLPEGWTRSATSLKQTGTAPHSFVAENFDELVDSPIVAGNISVYPFTAGGVNHQLVNVGESGYWDGTKAATDLKRIVEAHQRMWKVIPYDRYLFLNVIGESGGGLEHDNSCLMMTSRWSFRDDRRYQSWLSLASHEFFHTWNVRRLRPQPLAEYDYENEVYTDGLWIAEGVTSYYEDLALVRAGITSRNEFLTQLSRNVEGVQRTNGRKVQSLKESSFDTWIKFYRPDENASNTRISYYSKGAVAAFLLDAKIRKLTQGKKSLDDVMRKMFQAYSKSGFTSEQFRKTASDVAGNDLSDWFASAIDSTDELDYADIEFLGIVVPNAPQPPTPTKPETSKNATKASDKRAIVGKTSEEKAKGKQASENPSQGSEKTSSKKKRKRKKKKEQELKADQEMAAKIAAIEAAAKRELRPKPAPKTATTPKPAPVAAQPKPAPKPKPWLGISTSESEGKVLISRVKPDSPGFDVGLNTDDEVIAMNGFRISRSVESRLSQYEVGEEIELLIARRGKLMTVRVEIGKLETENWRLRFVPKPSEAQKAQLDQWLKFSDESNSMDQ